MKKEKVVILAGGLGTRLSEETILKPKPMVEIGGKPILWHIMKIYSHWGYNEFVICLGYKGYVIKEYFYNYFLHQADVTIDLQSNQIEYQSPRAEPWKIHLVDTGELTMTGGRVKRIKNYVKDDDYFLLTYGDAVTNLNIPATVDHFKKTDKLAMLTAVKPPGRFGNLSLNGSIVDKFVEKPEDTAGLINGGFFVLSPKVIDYIVSDETTWELDPLNKLVADKQLAAFIHTDFWQPMDTLYERNMLERDWKDNCAAWKLWGN
jgi:glucose-1-phosphate cytidylyltransferase